MSGFLPSGLNNPNASKGDVNRGAGPSTSLLERRLTSEGERATLSRLNGPSSLGTALGPSTSTPISPSSAMAHRGPYSRPSLLDQSRPTTNRFTPYSRKPIFVGARRVEDKDAVEPHLTSTAQRIIDILQRNTTPVVEGLKKVPIHTSIKSLKPIQNTLRGGPPVTRSPFSLGEGSPRSLPVPPKYLLPRVPSQNPSPTSSAVQQLPPTIAKTMPFAPLPVGAVSTVVPFQDFSYEGEPKSSGGGKIKGKTTRLHEHPTHQRHILPPPRDVPLALLPREFAPVSSASSSNVIVPMDSADSGPIKFDVAKAWTSSLYQSGTSSLPNGYPEEEDGFWERLLSVVKENDGNMFGRKAIGPPKPATTSPAMTSRGSSQLYTTWPCPTCMISNKFSELKCVCCTAPRPSKYSELGHSGVGDTVVGLSSWPCPSCMVSNKLTEAKCVCCTEARPAKYSSGVSSTSSSTPVVTPTPIPTTWECPTCMVTNQMSEVNCVCCTETRPAKYGAVGGSSTATTTSTSTPPPATEFKFGFSTQSTTAPPPPPSSISTFSFGNAPNAPKTSDAPPQPTFVFGVPTSSSSSTQPAPAATKFGVSGTSGHSTSPASGFQFGLTSPVTPKSTEPQKSPMSADSFRKGFSFSSRTTPTPNGNLESLTTTSTSSPTPPVVKFPTIPPVEEKKDPDAEIDKYKFKPFFGGPKPPPTTAVETKTQITFATPTVSAAPTPISFGSNPLSAPPPPTVNGGIDTVDKPKPATPFSFGLANSTSLITPAATTTATGTGSIPTSTPFSFGITTTSPIPAPTTTTPSMTTGGFNFNASSTTTTTTGTPTPAPALNFSFGTGETHKRKAPSEEVPGGGGFTFNSSEPKLKMRIDGSGINPVTSQSSGGMKTGSFLDAMKQPGFGSVDNPDGKLFNNAFSMTNNNNNNTTSSLFTNPNAGFQFQPSAQLPPPPPPSVVNPIVPSGGFNFNNAQIPSSLQAQAPSFNNSVGGFNFGSQPPSSTPQFNLVPNLAFGQNATGAPPPSSAAPVLFSAGAPPPSQVNDIGRRPTKRAVRRLR